MLKDRDFLYGAAILRLINFGNKVTVRHCHSFHNSLYYIESPKNCSVVLFKLSTKPTSSWQFKFSNDENNALRKISGEFTNEISLFLSFICHKDGVCCISRDNLTQILDRADDISGQCISISRPPKGCYRVRGPGRKSLHRTIPQNNWPHIIL
jgi:hypothetical protein